VAVRVTVAVENMAINMDFSLAIVAIIKWLQL